jgi:hypothetical protein
MTARPVRVGLAAAVLLSLAGCPAVESVSSGAPRTAVDPSAARATIVVDTGRVLGPLNNPARYHNQADHSLTLRPPQEQRVRAFEPLVARAWLNPRRYYNAVTGAYTWDYPSASDSTAYSYLDQVTRYSRELMVNIDQCHQIFMTLATPQICRQMLKDGLRHYKSRYPELRYVELFNEPDRNWDTEPDEPQAMTVEQYYRWYQIGYEVVNEVNAELSPEVPLRLGGPVSYTFNASYLQDFIALYAADPNPAKRLDFVSYHEYRARDNPAAVEPEKRAVQGWLTARGLPADTPVFVTEYGVFPGPNTGTTFQDDLLTQAAAMETLGYFYVTGGMDMVMHWVFDHPTNDRKSMFVDGDENGVYPYYNMVAMQRMLRSSRVSARSDALSPAGLGVHALATVDQSGVTVLANNYQWTAAGTPYAVAVKFTNLPAEFTGRRVRVERYLVDSKTSNYTFDKSHAGLQRVEQYELDAGTGTIPLFPLGRNAMTLLVLTPVAR